MGVLTLVLGAASAMYVGPKALDLAWRGGPTWVGKTMLTWAIIAVAYDLTFNSQEGDAFTTQDAVLTGLGTLFIRVVM